METDAIPQLEDLCKYHRIPSLAGQPYLMTVVLYEATQIPK